MGNREIFKQGEINLDNNIDFLYRVLPVMT